MYSQEQAGTNYCIDFTSEASERIIFERLLSNPHVESTDCANANP
jgi:hypothetical protein